MMLSDNDHVVHNFGRSTSVEKIVLSKSLLDYFTRIRGKILESGINFGENLVKLIKNRDNFDYVVINPNPLPHRNQT